MAQGDSQGKFIQEHLGNHHPGIRYLEVVEGPPSVYYEAFL